MIANGKALFDFIDIILRKEGYIKKKNTWYRATEECICFFSIGKSPYGGYYDHVMGCFLKQLNTTGKEFPVYYKNDLKFSIDNFVDPEFVRRVLDLENSEFKDDQREFLIKEFFELYVIPFLNDVGSKEGIKAAVCKYEDLIYYIKGRTRELLCI